MLPNYIKQTVTITILQSKLQHEKKVSFCFLMKELDRIEKACSVAADEGWISKIVLHVN